MIDASNRIIWRNRVKFISENYKYYEEKGQPEKSPKIQSPDDGCV